jgi:hypothetical protein
MTTSHNRAATLLNKRFCIGPLSPHIKGFAALLIDQGYAATTLHIKFRLWRI